MRFQLSAGKLIIMRPVKSVFLLSVSLIQRPDKSSTYANSTSQSCSMTVKSLMKLFDVSTTSWKITHPVVAVRVKSTDDG
jgi:hypothetical protein